VVPGSGSAGWWYSGGLVVAADPADDSVDGFDPPEDGDVELPEEEGGDPVEDMELPEGLDPEDEDDPPEVM